MQLTLFNRIPVLKPALWHKSLSKALSATALYFALSSLSFAAGSLQELLTQANAALAKQDAEQAYQILFENELEYAGDENYDYMFGVVAIQAGKPARAIFALERVLEVNPKHAGARIELATAYMLVGQEQAASLEIERLEQASPPPAAGKRLRDLKAAVEYKKGKNANSNSVGYARIEAGHDSNPGTWPEDDNFFLGAPIAPAHSGFERAQLGYWHQFNAKHDNKFNLWLNGSASHNIRDNINSAGDDASQFDQDSWTLRGEWLHDKKGANIFSVGADAGGLYIDNESYYESHGAYASWAHRKSEQTQLSVKANVLNADFETKLYDYVQTGLTFASDIKSETGARFNINLKLLYNKNVNDRYGGDNTDSSLNFSYSKIFKQTQRFGINTGVGMVDYKSRVKAGQAINNLVSKNRGEEYYTVGAFYDWFLEPNVSLTLRTDYREQNSSLDAYDYDKHTGSIALSVYF